MQAPETSPIIERELLHRASGKDEMSAESWQVRAEQILSKSSQAVVKHPATFLASGFVIGGVIGWLTNKLK